MKRLLPIALLGLAAAGVVRAQDERLQAPSSNANVAADFSETSAALSSQKWTAGLPLVSAARPLSASEFAEPAAAPAPAAPQPSPASPQPSFAFGSRDDFRWEVALGISLVRFRSSQYYATGVGTNTSLTYYTNEWLGIEGNANTAFAPTIYQNVHVKYVSYGAGPKVSWRARRLEPWAHAIVGAAHILPRTAAGSSNAFGYQVGGGVDYRFYPHLAARVELDWVRSHFFGEWQNSVQANADIVLHF